MQRPEGHYIAEVDSRQQVIWWSGAKFFLIGNTIPHPENAFDRISESPIDLASLELESIKGSLW